MQKFAAFAVATLVSAAMFASVPAKADMNPGPVKKGTQCWVGFRGTQDYGYWAACPQPASTTTSTVAVQPRRARHLSDHPHS